MRRSTLIVALVCGSMFVGSVLPEPGGRSVHAQGTKSSRKSTRPTRKRPLANTQSLDVRADQLQTSFVKEAEELASDYVDAGHLEKAKLLLRSVQVLSPEDEGIQRRLQQIEDTIINANDFEIDVNPSHGWEAANATVFEKKPVRIKVEGSYRLILSTSVDSKGFVQQDTTKDMITGIPCGALMGVIVPPKGKPGKPFLIGDGTDFTPKETGALFLRVNCPLDNKNTGKLRVYLSGYVKGG